MLGDIIEILPTQLLAIFLAILIVITLINILMLCVNIPIVKELAATKTPMARAIIMRKVNRQQLFGKLQNLGDWITLPHQLICIAYLKHIAKR